MISTLVIRTILITVTSVTSGNNLVLLVSGIFCKTRPLFCYFYRQIWGIKPGDEVEPKAQCAVLGYGRVMQIK